MADIQLGLMTRGQFPQGDAMQLRFEEMFEQIRPADKLGFSCITKGMHYSSWRSKIFRWSRICLELWQKQKNAPQHGGSFVSLA